MTTIADFAACLETWFPLNMAADWDNVGLLLGDGAMLVERVMTCLTVTPEAVREAVRERIQLIVSHHPILFRPVQKVTTTNAEGRMLLDLAKAGIAVYSPHTAFDNASGGINDGLCRRLGLANVRPLRPLAVEKNVKLVVFVPDSDLAKVSDALFTAGAGKIGQYRECSFRLTGTGTFFGSEAANPTVGQKGRREVVAETRLEVVCPQAKVEAVVRALRKAHSYEEPAFDLYPLQADPSRQGQGRLGELSTPTSLEVFANMVKEALGVTTLQTVGEPDKKVRVVALACGAAGEFLGDAARAKADVFLTGEIRFHEALTAQSRDLGLVIPGHYATERPAVEDLAERLALQFPRQAVWPSRDERDPLR